MSTFSHDTNLQAEYSAESAHLRQIGGTFRRTFHPRAYVVVPPESEVTPQTYIPNTKLGLFTVKRMVKIDECDLFANSNIEETMQSYSSHGIIPRKIGLSLVGLNEARRIRKLYRDESDEELTRRYIMPATKLPARRFCRSSDVDVFGVPDPLAGGMRHVVLKLDSKSEKRLRKERSTILKGFGLNSSDFLDETPHITLFKTPDPLVAAELCEELYNMIPRKMPIILARPLIMESF